MTQTITLIICSSINVVTVAVTAYAYVRARRLVKVNRELWERLAEAQEAYVTLYKRYYEAIR